jgi:hypothetical protein
LALCLSSFNANNYKLMFFIWRWASAKMVSDMRVTICGPFKGHKPILQQKLF